MRWALLLAAVVLVAGCGSTPADWSKPRPTPKGVGALGPGFVDGTPAPEATIVPTPGSWDDVHPSKGYRVVLLTAGHDRATQTLTDAVRAWAGDEHVSLKTVTADDPDRHIEGITRAMALKPDLIISAGNDLVDALALVTASHLDRQFLLVGSEVAEPTENVTAADWVGAGFRGEGLGLPPTYDAATFTDERAGRAIRAGVAAVLNGLTGIVIQVD